VLPGQGYYTPQGPVINEYATVQTLFVFPSTGMRRSRINNYKSCNILSIKTKLGNTAHSAPLTDG
jgi:hypothetical protein